MKKASILLCALLILSLVLCACGGGGKNSLVGTWTGEKDGVTMTMTFNEDKTGSLSALGGLLTANFTYTDDGSRLIMTPEESMEDVLSFNDVTYTFEGDNLLLTGNDGTITFTKN